MPEKAVEYFALKKFVIWREWLIGWRDCAVSLPPEKIPLPDLIKRHPPERRERKKQYVVLYACCSCCCCCLHTVGGAIGAAWGGNYRAADDLSTTLLKRNPSSYPSSQWLYWSSFLLAIPLVGFFIWVTPVTQTPSEFVELIGLSIILAGPLWLLIASLVTAIRLAFRSDLPSKSEYWRQLRRISFGVVIGSLAGVGVMLAILGLIVVSSK